MINLYRFCIAIFFASISFVFAQDNCEIVQEIDYAKIEALNIKDGCKSIGSGACRDSSTYSPNVEKGVLSLTVVNKTFRNGVETSSRSDTSDTNIPIPYISKEVCDTEEPSSKPDLTDWENCKIGKDHGFYWVTIGDGNGEGESRFKREWWSCDEPDFFKEYNHPPDDKPTDPKDPTDPKPGEGGDGDKPGEGGDNGNNGNGNNNGNNNGDSEVKGNYEKDDLTCTGSNCSGSNANKGNVPSFSDSDIYSSSNSSKTFNDVFNENFKGIDNTAIGDSLNSFIPVLPVGKCPTFYFEPLNINIGVMNINLFDGAGADIPCWIWDLIGTFIVIFAVMYSRTIIMGA